MKMKIAIKSLELKQQNSLKCGMDLHFLGEGMSEGGYDKGGGWGKTLR